MLKKRTIIFISFSFSLPPGKIDALSDLGKTEKGAMNIKKMPEIQYTQKLNII